MTIPATLLSIDGMDFTEYDARSITVQLRPEQNGGTLERDWNGNLVDLTIVNFRKYQVSISTSDDLFGPPFADVWRGSGPYTVRLIPDMIANTGETDNILTLSTYVDDWSISRNEWGAETGWQVDLREA